MPGRDGTGPMGMGPMTGRGAGVCSGYAQAGNYRQGRGAGAAWAWYGMGRGMGRGRGRWWLGWSLCRTAIRHLLPKQVEILKNQAASSADGRVNNRIAGLEAAPANK